jgi:hypothetical protein
MREKESYLMGGTEEGSRALNENRKAQLKAKVSEPRARQEPQPPVLESGGLTLTEEQRHRIDKEERTQREQPQGTPPDSPEDALDQPIRLWHAVGISVVVIVLLIGMMAHLADRRNARRAEQARLAVQKAEQKAAEHKEAAVQRGKEEAEFGSVLTAGQ